MSFAGKSDKVAKGSGCDKSEKGGTVTGGGGDQVIPPPRDQAPERPESGPKVSRVNPQKVKPKDKSPSARTVHYSPDPGVKAKTTKTQKPTAAKACPKAKPKANPVKPVKVEHGPAKSSDVQAALTRKTTAQLRTSPPAASSPSDASEDHEAEAAPEDREMTYKEVLAKKAAHARFMRFSRSLKSKSFLATTTSRIWWWVGWYGLVVLILILKYFSTHVGSINQLQVENIANNYNFQKTGGLT